MPDEYESITNRAIKAMNVPGMLPGGRLGGRGNAGIDPQQVQEQQMIKYMQMAMESCPAKTVIAGTMGFGLGSLFGLFMSSMRYDTPLTPQGAEIYKLPVRQQLRQGFKEMGRASFSSAKNFGMVGAIFSGTECCIEGFRAKNDLANGVAAGCITGGALAAKAGPQAAAVGCAGFAAFSAAIDYYMRMPGDDGASPVI
ncbi:mitochondrial import inner membrane translocase subunit Tim22 [Cryomyces antarcticus]|uniref:Mitochondrial import inner membrane translocase subunit TIM22 n=1 Tax=Cryomyces antarcticus TaxID=329879 RepID=A0ABR0M1C6_9PEZI|nr:Mitochondrial import inner membrane translocase subunit tim22 [Cryomyces antarcticus]KAK5020600.1 Mitochondrial import inner membrane translocase subunit tim22 [Cryomyces antarcticus]KAK5257392.1 Mitochondrial import inner membrane translocase subunit tim22 [Cryomyces antarcticus]